MGNTSGLVRVRVRAQGKTVIPGELISEEHFNKARSNLIWVCVKERIFRGYRSMGSSGLVCVVRGDCHDRVLSRPNILITPLARAVLTHKSGAHEANKGQINLYEY
jgi:hypothetical protein